MIPLVKDMAPAFGGPDGLMPVWWALSLGACLGGNGTIIGASANLTVAGLAERAGIRFAFVEYMKVAYPVMLSGSLLLAVVAARFLPSLHETISPRQIVGMVVVVIGVWLVVRP